QNKDITLYGDGSQTRSFCYRDDLLEGLVRMMATPHEVTGPVNLGMPREFTIRELAELTIKLTNSNSKLIFCDLPADDPKQRKPDITLAKQLLDWQPTTPLEVGLQKTIEYCEELLRADYEFCQG
ncbi:MAG: NAD-dependent epimerase/dehydratase family protein, partial [Lentisphaeria bacterium]|nr:NAD-dependent epimerase/dehydratase family protein [Lentisphaeria bacterium]